jgi:hypothetical protein
MGKPPANNQKRLQRMERDLVKNRDYMEAKERERDAARTAMQSTDNQAVISASKPKAKKAREAEAVKQAKAAKQIDKAADKAKAAADREKLKQAKTADREKVRLEKKNEQMKKKKKKEEKKRRTDEWDGAGRSEGEDESETTVDPDAEKVALPWKEWVVMAHVSEEGCCRFQVAVYGYPPEEGEEEVWATYKNIKSDHAQELIDKYIQDHANFPPYSDLLIRTKRQPKEKVTPPAQVDNTSPCRHGDYQGSYIKEDHPGHCKTGGYLHKIECAGVDCKKTFAPDLKEVKRLGINNASRPTSDKPVYCCVNIAGRTGVYREEVCKHALCNECWSRAMLADDEGKTAAAGTKRRATRSN